jgi:hypothetical protein
MSTWLAARRSIREARALHGPNQKAKDKVLYGRSLSPAEREIINRLDEAALVAEVNALRRAADDIDDVLAGYLYVQLRMQELLKSPSAGWSREGHNEFARLTRAYIHYLAQIKARLERPLGGAAFRRLFLRSGTPPLPTMTWEASVIPAVIATPVVRSLAGRILEQYFRVSHLVQLPDIPVDALSEVTDQIEALTKTLLHEIIAHHLITTVQLAGH